MRLKTWFPEGGAFGGGFGTFKRAEISWRKFVTGEGFEMLQLGSTSFPLSGSELVIIGLVNLLFLLLRLPTMMGLSSLKPRSKTTLSHYVAFRVSYTPTGTTLLQFVV